MKKNKLAKKIPSAQAVTEKHHYFQLVDRLLFIATLICFNLIPLIVDSSAERMFDTAKAFYLKVPMSIITIVWAIRVLFTKDVGIYFAKARVFAYPFLFFGLTYIISSLFSVDPWMSLVGIYIRQFGLTGWFCCIAGYFILTTTARSAKDAQYLILPLLFSSLIISIHGFMQIAGNDPFRYVPPSTDGRLLRLTSFLGNANFVGNFFSMVLPFGLYWIIKKKTRLPRLFSILMFLTILVGLLMSQTRGSWVALLGAAVFWAAVYLFFEKNSFKAKYFQVPLGILIVGTFLFAVITFMMAQIHRPIIVGICLVVFSLGFYGWLAYAKKSSIGKKRGQWIFGIATVCITIISAVMVFGIKEKFYIVNRIVSIFELEKSIRYHLWKCTLEIIKDFPLFGTGPESFRQIFPPYKTRILEALQVNVNYDNPHNGYLYILATLGPLGLFAQFWLIGTIFKKGFSQLQREVEENKDWFFTLAILTALFAYIIWNLPGFDSIATYTTFTMIFASFAIHSLNREKALVHFGNQYLIKVLLIISIPCAFWMGKTMYGFFQTDKVFKLGSVYKFHKRYREAIHFYDLAHQQNPNESYYVIERSKVMLDQAKIIKDKEISKNLVLKSEQVINDAFSHVWAPENIYIAKTNGRILMNDLPNARMWCLKALEVSPHITTLLTTLHSIENAMRIRGIPFQ